MTTIPGLSDRKQGNRGFTLAELLIGMGLAAIVASALFASWGFIARSTVSIASYSEMNSQGRTGLDTFARDIRMARDISDFSETGMTLIMDADGADLIHYRFDNESGAFLRVRDGEEDTLFRHVEDLALSRFTILRTPATNDLETKQIQLELRMARETVARQTSNKIVSARYIMRNKQVAQ